MEKYDFCGWATRNDLTCSDGRIIRRDAFKHNDGRTVPLCWNHDHSDPYRIVGHALLENRDEGVYTYCKFNETDLGKTAKIYVEHGDITSLSIYANQLKQQGPNVMHGEIREVSLVMAGANPGAFIENVIKHNDEESEDEVIIHTGLKIELEEDEDEEEVVESEETEDDEETEEVEEESEEAEEEDLSHADDDDESEETVADVFNTLTDKQKTVVYAMIGQILEEESGEKNSNEKIEHSEGGNESMKHNVFEKAEEVTQSNVLSHADQAYILEMAKKSNVGSLKEALRVFAEEKGLQHGLDLGDSEVLEELLPDYKNLTPGAPEVLGPDQSWVMAVINRVHKSPYSRIRTRHADARSKEVRETIKAKGYNKREEEKKLTGALKLIGRSHDPQTIYVKDELHRDDIIDITDFDLVAYVWKLMKDNFYETLALAILVGDGREATDPDKIKEEHIQPIWSDDELYTIHRDVDVEGMKAQLQGTDTNAHFGENYIFAEAVITESLYSREQFKGSGRPDFYCAPHTVNKMLLARDFNGRRIYDNKADLVQALNVNAIHEIEQFDGLTRVDEESGKTKKLLGIFVNLADYQLGATKGGEVTKFDDFDIDFNTYKYLMEARHSGALTKLWSAIALEETVPTAEG